MFFVCVALQPERVQAQISTPAVVQVACLTTCLSLKLCPSAGTAAELATWPQPLREHLYCFTPVAVQVGCFVTTHLYE